MNITQKQKQIFIQSIAGYKEANKITETELKQTLQNMTAEESIQIYDSLCNLYYNNKNRKDDLSGRLDKEYINEKIKIRQRMNKILQIL